MLRQVDPNSGAIIMKHDPSELEAEEEYRRGKTTEVKLNKLLKMLGITEEDLDQLPNPDENGEVLEREE